MFVTIRSLAGRGLEQDKLGAACIDSVRPSDAKEWALRMKANGVAYKTISNDKRSLKAAFYIAMQDDYIRKNPFDFRLQDVIEDDTEPKMPLSPEMEKEFLLFIQYDPVYYKYYDEIVILLETGLRISEFSGLTISDIDFENRLINVDHQLLKGSGVDYYIEIPKTQSGIRKVPMRPKAEEALRRVLAKRKVPRPFSISGYRDFLFLNRDGLPKTSANYASMFRGLVKKLNKHHEAQLPKVTTAHTMRHTFCTKMANIGMNPKALQYIMGHTNITMTLQYYAHATFESAQAEMDRLTRQEITENASLVA